VLIWCYNILQKLKLERRFALAVGRITKQPPENSVSDEFAMELDCLDDNPSIAGEYVSPEVELGCLNESL